jgi:hypothetical protein
VLVAGATSTEGSVPSGYAGAGPQCAAGGSGGELLAGGLACTSGPRRDSGGENSEGDEYFDWRLHKACARQRIVGTSKLRSLRRVVAIAKCSEGLDSGMSLEERLRSFKIWHTFSLTRMVKALRCKHGDACMWGWEGDDSVATAAVIAPVTVRLRNWIWPSPSLGTKRDE